MNLKRYRGWFMQTVARTGHLKGSHGGLPLRKNEDGREGASAPCPYADSSGTVRVYLPMR